MSTVSPGFERLPDDAAAGPQKQVLDGLLRDRARAAQALAAPGVAERHPDRLDIEAVVVQELLVFRRDHS